MHAWEGKGGLHLIRNTLLLWHIYITGWEITDSVSGETLWAILDGDHPTWDGEYSVSWYVIPDGEFSGGNTRYMFQNPLSGGNTQWRILGWGILRWETPGGINPPGVSSVWFSHYNFTVVFPSRCAWEDPIFQAEFPCCLFSDEF